ncbi:MAG: magnesium transporter [Deltaproteobacteria bacterium]|nr:magnesium transporter [Deltaproteobacteria bacterium]
MASSVSDLDNDDLEAVLLADDGTAAAFLRLLPHPADVVEALRAVDVKQWPRLLRLVSDDSERAETVALLEEDERGRLLEMLGPEEIGQLIKNLDSDDATDVLEDLEPSEQKEALLSLLPHERAQVEDLLRYEPDTAGGIMQVERAQVKQTETVDDAVGRVRALVEDDIQVSVVYVVDDEERLIGVVEIARLLLHRKEKKISELVEPVIAKVHPDVDQEQVAQLFKKYGMFSLPVVDKEGRLLGRILHDDVIDVVVEEAEEDALKQAGTSSEELLYRDRVFAIARVRLPWLIVTLMGSMVSAKLIHLYAGVLNAAIVLAAFVPVVTAMGGNVGTQSATILTRGIATGRVDLRDLFSVVFRELRVGLLMGLVCGAAVGGIAILFFSDGKVMLGFVVFAAMVCAMTVAATVGTLAPALMKRGGIDPAIASGPFVTTANDSIGIVIYLSTALFFLEKLK